MEYSRSIHTYSFCIHFDHIYNFNTLISICPIKCLSTHKNALLLRVHNVHKCIVLNSIYKNVVSRQSLSFSSPAPFYLKKFRISSSLRCVALQFHHVQCAMCIVQYCLCITALHDFCCGYNTNVLVRTFSFNSKKCTLLLYLLNERVLSFPTGSLCITSVFMALYLSLLFFRCMGGRASNYMEIVAKQSASIML